MSESQEDLTDISLAEDENGFDEESFDEEDSE